MVHLRATGQVRILVAVIDIKKIPKLADVCAINSIYRMYFKPDEVVQHDASDPKDDDLLADTDKGAEGEDREKEDAENPDPTSENNYSKSDKAPAPSQNMTHQQLASLVNEALDTACEELINEISIRVMLEPDDGTLRKNYTPLSEEELTAYNNLVNSPNKLQPSSVFLTHSLESGDVPDNTLHCSEDDVAVIQDSMGGSTSPPTPLADLDPPQAGGGRAGRDTSSGPHHAAGRGPHAGLGGRYCEDRRPHSARGGHAAAIRCPLHIANGGYQLIDCPPLLHATDGGLPGSRCLHRHAISGGHRGPCCPHR